MITADEVRRLIVDHDAARPRSQQTSIGPSDLSSPCDRKLVYQLLGVPRVAQQHVNLYAWVGTQMHGGLEAGCKHDNAVRTAAAIRGEQPHESGFQARWLTEVRVTVPVTDTVSITGNVDAFDLWTGTAIDWKSRGASTPTAKTRAKHHTQLLPYGLGLILLGHEVKHTAVVYIPRNGTLADIEVDTRPFDHDAAEQLLRRYEALIAAAGAGVAVLPLVPVADDCTYCPFWLPGWPGDPSEACPGAQALTKTPGVVPVEHNTTTPTPTETRTAS